MQVLTQCEAETAIVPSRAVDKPHDKDKAHRAARTDGREVGDRVTTIVFQYRKCCSIGQGQRRHVESDT